MAIATTAAILGAAAIGAGGSVLAGMSQAGASRSASAAQVQSANTAAQVQRDTVQQARIDNFPAMLIGTQALYRLSDELGIPRPENPILPDLSSGPFAVENNGNSQSSQPSLSSLGQDGTAQQLSGQNINMTAARGFQQTPGYQFQLNEGINATKNNLSALGLAGSTKGQRDINSFAQGLANQNYGNYLNRISSLAGVGQTVTGQNNQLAAQAAGNIGNAAIQSGNARASGYINQGNAQAGMIQGITQNITGTLGQLSQIPRQPVGLY